ncbi:MAG TPA: VWA domain-containing protein [Gemmataceae bacterium]|nr:VWA domain-containing protein [Gemmataceae bacterium]
MRRNSLVAAAILGGVILLLPTVTAPAAPADAAQYKIALDPDIVISHEKDGKKGLYVQARFKATYTADGKAAPGLTKDDLIVLEDGKEMVDIEIIPPNAEALTTMVAVDISGSTAASSKIEEARKAAHTFLENLNPKADSGLILFDQPPEPPGRDPSQFAAHREALYRKVRAAKAGATAYLDDTVKALRLLQSVSGPRAVVLMTDGMDLNSSATQAQVIALAKSLQIPIYPIGIGDPSAGEITTVLVLDHSGSMAAKAEEGDPKSKIEALRDAASRFVDLMPATAQTTLLPFSSDIPKPLPFSSKKADLKEQIQALQPATGTLLYDAAWTGVETLAASRLPGKKAVVVLTDGVDESPGSRHSDRDVVEAAKAAGVKLYMLGLGPKEDINEQVMQEMATDTGGAYFHAENQQKLFDVFAKLSIDLHDEGIDEKALKALANQTGGRYYPSPDVSQLSLVSRQVSEDLASTYTVIYPSVHPDDGTARKVQVLVQRNGRVVSEGGEGGYAVHGVLVPQINHLVYLILLIVLAALLAAPGGLRRLHKMFGG